MSSSVLILQLAVLGIVLESDLGLRNIGWFRVLRPVIGIIIIVPFFFTSLPTAGGDLLLQGAGALAGAALGLFAVSPWLVKVSFDPAYRGHLARLFRLRRPPRPATVTRAGWGYALLWIVVCVARLAFAYGSEHVFPGTMGQFLVSNSLSVAALTNAFIFLSVGMDLFRSVGLVARGRMPGRPQVRAAGADRPAVQS